MDLAAAQDAYAKALAGVDMVVMLSSMLHSIGVGNMLPSWVKVVCVDINPAVVTKLSDRGSTQTIGIVTDVGLFLHQLATALQLSTCSNNLRIGYVTTLIRPRARSPSHRSDWVVVDYRFDLADPAKANSIPSRRTSPARDMRTSIAICRARRREPTAVIRCRRRSRCATRFGALGIAPDTQVVVYDADSGDVRGAALVDAALHGSRRRCGARRRSRALGPRGASRTRRERRLDARRVRGRAA